MRSVKFITAAACLAGAIGMGFLTAHHFQEFDKKAGALAEEHGYVLTKDGLTYDGVNPVPEQESSWFYHAEEYKELNRTYVDYHFLTMGGGFLMALVGVGFGAAGLAEEEETTWKSDNY